MNPNLLSAKAILSAFDRKFEDVPVPEWGGDVRIAVMSGITRDEFTATKSDGFSDFQARLLLATAIDADGAPLFTGDQIAALQSRSSEILDRLTEIAMRVNAMGEKAQEDVAKNSEAAVSGASGSDLPATSASQ